MTEIIDLDSTRTTGAYYMLPPPPSILYTHSWYVYNAGLLHSSVIRASTAKVRGLEFDSQWLPMHFFSQYSILIYHKLLTTSSYPQLSISKVTKPAMIGRGSLAVRRCLSAVPPGAGRWLPPQLAPPPSGSRRPPPGTGRHSPSQTAQA